MKWWVRGLKRDHSKPDFAMKWVLQLLLNKYRSTFIKNMLKQKPSAEHEMKTGIWIPPK